MSKSNDCGISCRCRIRSRIGSSSCRLCHSDVFTSGSIDTRSIVRLTRVCRTVAMMTKVLAPCLVLRTISENSVPLPKGLDACKALRGFLIMLNRSGKLLHVSDNASEYLGHSIVRSTGSVMCFYSWKSTYYFQEEIMCQGDSIFDLVDPRDHPTVQTELNSGPQPTTSFPEERVFLCRLNLARTAKRQLQYHKVVPMSCSHLNAPCFNVPFSLFFYKDGTSIPLSTFSRWPTLRMR